MRVTVDKHMIRKLACTSFMGRKPVGARLDFPPLSWTQTVLGRSRSLQGLQLPASLVQWPSVEWRSFLYAGFPGGISSRVTPPASSACELLGLSCTLSRVKRSSCHYMILAITMMSPALSDGRMAMISLMKASAWASAQAGCEVFLENLCQPTL